MRRGHFADTLSMKALHTRSSSSSFDMLKLSDFQKEKCEYLFTNFYDKDKNGVLTRTDFIETLKVIQKLRKWHWADSRMKKCESSLNRAWTYLKNSADGNKDRQVTTDEWLMFWDEFVKQSDNCDDGWPPEHLWVKEYMNFWFDVMDTSGDGEIDENEFVEMCACFDVDEEDARASFKRFGTHPVDRDYFSLLWIQYFTADFKACAGNFIFGKPSWQSK